MTVAEPLSGAATRLGLVVLLGAGVVAGLGSPGAGAATAGTARAAQPAWSVQPTPAIPSPSGNLSGVSCASGTFCVAVGWPGLGSAIAAAWNGTSWRRMSLTGSGLPDPVGVSCTSPAFCVAVGRGSGRPAIATWNGTAWTAQKSPSFIGDLEGVSCSSSAACLGVGEIVTARGNNFPTAERWDGTQWLRVAIPQQHSFYLGSLDAVSCTSATACTAVGYYWNGKHNNTSHAFIQAWDGTTWTAEQAAPTGFSDLYSVACTAPSACIAVGAQKTTSVKEKPLAESSG